MTNLRKHHSAQHHEHDRGGNYHSAEHDGLDRIPDLIKADPGLRSSDTASHRDIARAASAPTV